MAKKLDKYKMKCNKPKRTPSHATKTKEVKDSANGKEKISKIGKKGVTGAGKRANTAKEKARKK